MLKKIGVWVINVVIVIVLAWVIGKFTGDSETVTNGSNSTVNINLNGVGLIVWIIVLVIYFYGARKLWGKTVGGLIMEKLMPNR